MSVLIRGMEMPKGNSTLNVLIYSDGRIFTGHKNDDEYSAVEVPAPYGRLVDADALTKTISEHVYPVTDYFNSRDYGMFWTGGIEKAINEQPTIIEAEE